MLNRTIFELFL